MNSKDNNNNNNNNNNNSVIEKIVTVNNNIFSNDYIRTFVIIISGVFIGYTIQPIPKWLNNIFDTSHIFKFFVLFYTGAIALYPLTKDKIKWITVSVLVIMYLFRVFRNYK
jgi:hypothetical protein